MMSDWKVICGLEIHAELQTASKMFSACPVVIEGDPNTAVDAVTLGLPGTLPVINTRAIEFATMVGLALNCEIPQFNQFARKSYFYPDLPKGFQISQYDRPLAVNGWLDIDVIPEHGAPYSKRIRIRRAHLEEDTGKSMHVDSAHSLVDYNRAGVPLLEIVTEPDLNSAEEAEAFARKLRNILQYLGVNNGDMSKGVLRIEPNISVMHKDDKEFRTRTEVKNLNSIRSVFRSIKYEMERQIKAHLSGEGVKQATMGWDEGKQRTVVQRYKERADEYRYFPEPDLPIVEMTPEYVNGVRAHLPELPDAKRERLVKVLGLTPYDAGVLVAEQAVAHYYEEVLAAGADPKSAANWMISSLFAVMNKAGFERENIADIKITPQHLAALTKLVDSGTINKGTGVSVLEEMWNTGTAPDKIVADKGLAQVSDKGAIVEVVAQVLRENADMARDYLNGKDKLFMALVGAVMKATKGKGNAQLVRDVLTEQLEAMRGK
jgi:aspartyl-tRNA(Asn)/glutamyl-tRNA(Gln) amidotransferase subunit B